MPTIGSKVRLKIDYWFDPCEIIPQGATGVVVKSEIEKNETQPTIHVRLDQNFPQLEDHDNIVSFYPQCGPQTSEVTGKDMTTEEWFNETCEVL